MAGTPLAGGYFLVIWSIKSDLEHLAKFFGLEHYASNRPCVLCPCEAGNDAPQNLLFSNFSRSASWMSLLFTHLSWHTRNPSPHYLFQLKYLSGINYDPDELHLIHLGTSTHLLGSVLWLLVYEIMTDTPVANMKAIWTRITSLYKDMDVKCAYSNLTLNSFVNPKSPHNQYPRLKGKGAEIKDLMEPMYAVWQEYKRPSRDEAFMDNLVSKALSTMCQIQGILHYHADDNFLPTTVAEQFRKLVNNFLVDYSKLAHLADSANMLLFNVVPKHHGMWHLGQRAKFLNPRKGNTMIDEDFVGKIKDLVSSSAHGTESHLIPTKVFEKYTWGCHILWTYSDK